MRTTIRLDDALLEEAKQHAAQTGRSLTQLVEDALREVLARSRRGREHAPVRLPTMTGRGVQPGVDLDSSASLLDLMERSRDPD